MVLRFVCGMFLIILGAFHLEHIHGARWILVLLFPLQHRYIIYLPCKHIEEPWKLSCKRQCEPILHLSQRLSMISQARIQSIALQPVAFCLRTYSCWQPGWSYASCKANWANWTLIGRCIVGLYNVFHDHDLFRIYTMQCTQDTYIPRAVFLPTSLSKWCFCSGPETVESGS